MLSLVFLGACTTMSPEECKVADWLQVGQRDGLDGRPMSYLASRDEDCAKAGIHINIGAYKRGRDEGLRSYCRPDNAVRLGLSGASYAGVCPPETDAAFQQHYQAARDVYALRNDVRVMDERIDSLERRLRDLGRSEEKRLADAGSDEQRKSVRKAIDEERRQIRADISEADRRLRRLRDELRGAEFALSSLRV